MTGGCDMSGVALRRSRSRFPPVQWFSSRLSPMRQERCRWPEAARLRARSKLRRQHFQYELGTPDLSKTFGNFLGKVFHSPRRAPRVLGLAGQWLSSLVGLVASSPSGLEARLRAQGDELVELNWVRGFEAFLVEGRDIFACPVPGHLPLDS